MSGARRLAARDLAVVLGASWLVRTAFVVAIGDAHSNDVGHWELALETQDEGRNPYETGVLNWPPFWLVVIVALDYAAAVVDLSFWTALRVYLVAVESVLVVALYVTLLSVGASRDAVRRALLVGIALNPVAIILVCQHGNFDVTVGLLVTLTVAALLAHRRTREVVAWLAGCLFLGLGVLAKTAPLVLAPVLAPGARLVSRGGQALGATLLLLPAALGSAVIAALVPQAFLDHVLGYRSTRGFWGLAGLLEEVTASDGRHAGYVALGFAVAAACVRLWQRVSRTDSRTASYLVVLLVALFAVVSAVELLERALSIPARSRYETGFTIALVALVAWLFHRLRREQPLGPERLFLLVALVFLAVVAFGPGYGAHYAYWFIPALVATYVLLDDTWRRLLLVAWAVAGLTYAVEYAFLPFLGAWASAVFGSSEWITDAGDELAVPDRLVLFRIPLFATYLVLLAAGTARLVALRER